MNHEQAITRASKILVQNNIPLEPVAALELARMLREEPSAEPVEAFDHEAWAASLKPGVQLLQKSRGSWRTATVIPNPDWDKGNDEHVWTHAEGEADGYWQRDNTDDEEIRPLPTPSEADALRAELAETKHASCEAHLRLVTEERDRFAEQREDWRARSIANEERAEAAERERDDALRDVEHIHARASRAESDRAEVAKERASLLAENARLRAMVHPEDEREILLHALDVLGCEHLEDEDEPAFNRAHERLSRSEAAHASQPKGDGGSDV